MKLKYIATIYSSSFLRRFPNINKLPAIANPTPVNPTLVSVSPVLAKRFVTFGDCTSLYLSSLFIGESIATVPPLNSGISPIGGVQHGDDFHVFYSETEVGPVTRKLYDELTGIQFGDVEAPEGWIVKVD